METLKFKTKSLKITPHPCHKLSQFLVWERLVLPQTFRQEVPFIRWLKFIFINYFPLPISCHMASFLTELVSSGLYFTNFYFCILVLFPLRKTHWLCLSWRIPSQTSFWMKPTHNLCIKPSALYTRYFIYIYFPYMNHMYMCVYICMC